MKILSITIKDDECVIKWESSNKARWSVSSDRLMGARFGDAVKMLAEVASRSIKHDPDLMSVRSIVVSENKAGVTFVKLSGVLASVNNGPIAKPGKFTTPKIEITLFANAEMKEMEEAAKEYAKACGSDSK